MKIFQRFFNKLIIGYDLCALKEERRRISVQN
jgi:hypothetical protein